MNEPVIVTLPHKLGRAEARQRIAAGIDKLSAYVPGGADVSSHWQGDRLTLDVRAMGQAVTGLIDVEDHQVRLEFTLPPMLSLFTQKIRDFLSRKGGEMLEDKRGS
jgi:putative polyhydroxyalkanoate system protein